MGWTGKHPRRWCNKKGGGGSSRYRSDCRSDGSGEKRKRSVREQSVSSPNVTKGETWSGLDSASARVLVARVAKSTEEGAA